MKKLFSALLCVIMLLTFSGCSVKDTIASYKQEYIVASLGFDRVGSKIEMTLEAVVVNSEDLSFEKNSQLITGTGDTVYGAFAEINKKTTQPLMFNHCAAVIIGNGISGEILKDIFDFCYNDDEINLALMFVHTENANRLLSCKPLSSVAVGYDIVSMCEVVGDETGTNFHNRFYEIESESNKPMNTIYMPYMKMLDDSFFLDGLSVFRRNDPICTLNLEQAHILGIITDSLTKGIFYINNQKFKIESAKTKHEFAFDRVLKITLNIRLKTSGEKSEIKGQVEKLFFYFRQKYGDIFGIGNLIYLENPKVWQKIKGNYHEFFKTSKLWVNIDA